MPSGMTGNTLHKSERLYLRDAVGKLYAEGRSFVAFPYRVVFRRLAPAEAQVAPVAVMTVAPKRRLRHAVSRNRVKRLLREAYRLQKQPLVDAALAADTRLAVSFMFVGTAMPDFAATRAAVAKAIRRIAQAIA